jgi:hypothetical protein
MHEHLRAAMEEAGWPGPREFGRHGHRGRGFGPSEGERAERRERRGGFGGPGGRGRHGHLHDQRQGPEQVSSADVSGWLAGRLPDGWASGTPQITVDRDEIIIVVPLAAPEVADAGSESESAAAKAAAEAGRISRFREETRDERIRVAREAEHRYGRKVAWGASAGDTAELFTTMSVPVMTRLRQPERSVLDTLVDAGVARSRSDALAWCVRLVGEHAEDWLGQLREAMTAVERVRAEGPQL